MRFLQSVGALSGLRQAVRNAACEYNAYEQSEHIVYIHTHIHIYIQRDVYTASVFVLVQRARGKRCSGASSVVNF